MAGIARYWRRIACYCLAVIDKIIVWASIYRVNQPLKSVSAGPYDRKRRRTTRMEFRMREAPIGSLKIDSRHHESCPILPKTSHDFLSYHLRLTFRDEDDTSGTGRASDDQRFHSRLEITFVQDNIREVST